MTNNEYEKMSVDAATGQELLKQVDSFIDSLEKSLEIARELRREIVNRYDLNKCEHQWASLTRADMLECLNCGEIKR